VLVETFLAASPYRFAVETSLLESALSEVVQRARAAWPDIALADDEFIRELARRWSGREPLLEWLTSTHASDLYLAAACAHRTPNALQAFDRQLMSQVESFLSRMRPSAAFIDDVRQLVCQKLFVSTPPRIGEYSGRGPLSGWLRMVTLRTAIDLRRSAAERRGLPLEGALLAETAQIPCDPELAYLKERYAHDCTEALQLALRRLSSAQRSLLRRHYVEQRTLEELSALLGVHRVTLSRRLAAALDDIVAHAREVLGARLQLGTSAIDSLIELVRSQLDLSLPHELQDE
jgi:RNA polymerase sigma-70 factor (ECF subfamily)